MTKRTKIILIAAVLMCVAGAVCLVALRPQPPSNHIAVNDTVLVMRDFSVRSDSTELDTSAEGTVFIEGTEGIPDHVQIIASVAIDPDDWGGVSISIPKEWLISGILSSSPGSTTQADPADEVATWTTSDSDTALNKRIEIGRDSGFRPTGGGKGTVVIDLVPDQTAPAPTEPFSILIAVGSDERNGHKIAGTDFIQVELPLPAAGDDKTA